MASPEKEFQSGNGSTAKRQTLMERVVELYQEQKEIAYHVSLSGMAEECGINSLRVRKLLITAGIYENDISREIACLWKEGKSVREIQKTVGLSLSSIHSYLPYSRADYGCSSSNQEQPVQGCQTALEKLRCSTNALKLQEQWKKVPVELDELLWEALHWHQDCSFTTAKNLKFTYSIKGNEMFVSRKDKSITKATVLLAFHKAMELQRGGKGIAGPKKLGTFGASYLFPIFLRLGIITLAE